MFPVFYELENHALDFLSYGSTLILEQSDSVIIVNLQIMTIFLHQNEYCNTELNYYILNLD